MKSSSTLNPHVQFILHYRSLVKRTTELNRHDSSGQRSIQTLVPVAGNITTDRFVNGMTCQKG